MQILWTILLIASSQTGPLEDRAFTVARDGEAVAHITAGCARCDWGASGREAVVLTIAVDGTYSQHLILTRGATPAEYRVMLGRLPAGTHHLVIDRDVQRSAPNAGAVTFGPIGVETFDPSTPEYAWLSRAPFLRARPGTVEHFSDAPLVMYAEQNIPGESGSHYQLQYTVIFTNEDGGTPTDRLMATWGRTTDIEFIYGLTDPVPGSAAHEEIQAAGHKWIAFNGSRVGTHPMVWVATDNNMVADHGPDDMVRFAPAPQLVALDHTSRESVMDANPWMYAVTSGEMVREGRIDEAARAGSGKIPDPRRYATLEGCGDVKDATLAFDIGIRRGAGRGTRRTSGTGRGTRGIRGSHEEDVEWFATDRGEARFRIARGGCFRGGAPLPPGVSPRDIVGLRIRAYTRPPHEGEAPLPPGSGHVTLTRVNRVFMLDREFGPALAPIHWSGTLAVPVDSSPIDVPIPRR